MSAALQSCLRDVLSRDRKPVVIENAGMYSYIMTDHTAWMKKLRTGRLSSQSVPSYFQSCYLVRFYPLLRFLPPIGGNRMLRHAINTYV